MKNLVSIFAGHDANITFYNADKDEYHLIELERLVKKRYFRLHVDNSPEYQKEILTLCQEIAEEDWGIENDYEAVLISSDGFIQVDPKEIFNTDNVVTVARHHQTHAAAAFYLSPFKQALIVSYDGGGDDGHFNVYAANGKEIKLLKNIKSDFGGGYLLCGSMIREVAEKSKHQLALSGKLMGLCGYGKTNYDMVPAFEEFFFDRDYEKLSNWTNLPLKNIKNPWKNPLDNWVFEGQDGYDIAATAQAGFEDAFFSVLDRYDTEIPLIITGGCALNVLVNEKVKDYYNREVFVPPNPHDGSLSLGHMLIYNRPSKKIDITYQGLPLVDKNDLDEFIKEYNAKKITKKDIAKLIKDGKIIGLVYGDSEVGPRALGNRSLLADPRGKDIKQKMNEIKNRQKFRPFAPVILEEHVNDYFTMPMNQPVSPYMQVVATCKKPDEFPAVIHKDNTSRVQTVSKDCGSGIRELLEKWMVLTGCPILLNTSLNIRGEPMVNDRSDADRFENKYGVKVCS